MKKWMPFCVAAMGLAIYPGCISNQSAARMREIQQTQGLFTQSLWYRGSTAQHHYFDQDGCPCWWRQSGNYHYRVPLSQLDVPDALRFTYSASSTQATKIRLSDQEPFRVEPRMNWGERLHVRLEAEKQRMRQLGEYYVQVGDSLKALHDMAESVVETADTTGRLFAEGSKISSVIQHYHQTHRRWPASLEELRVFAMQKVDGSALIDWSGYGDATFSVDESGYLTVVYRQDQQQVELGISPQNTSAAEPD